MAALGRVSFASIYCHENGAGTHSPLQTLLPNTLKRGHSDSVSTVTPQKRYRSNPSENMTASRSRPENAQAAGRHQENENLSVDNIQNSNDLVVDPIDLSFGYTGALVDSDGSFGAQFKNPLLSHEVYGFWDESFQDLDLLSAVDPPEGLVSSAAGVITETEDIRRNESRSSNSSSWVEVDPLYESTDHQLSRSDASSSTSLVSISSNPGPFRRPANDSEAVNSTPTTKKPRGHFKSSEQREKTSRTRKMHACVRCRMQRVRVSVTYR